MQNKLWYIDQDVALTLYRSKSGTSSDAFVHSVTRSTLHHLWHHCLCYAGRFVTDNIVKVADGIPSLKKRNPFSSCGDCSSEKMTQQIKGYNKTLDQATEQGGGVSTWIMVLLEERQQLKTKLVLSSLVNMALTVTCLLWMSFLGTCGCFCSWKSPHPSPPSHLSFPTMVKNVV